jgi:molecular chaperone DnaK
VDAIGRAVETLKAASQQMGQKIYEAAGAANTTAGGGSGPDSSGSGAGQASDDEVVDAEIVDEPGTGTEGV